MSVRKTGRGATPGDEGASPSFCPPVTQSGVQVPGEGVQLSKLRDVHATWWHADGEKEAGAWRLVR